MPKKPDFTFEVRIRISEAFTLDSIVRRPRTFKPKDVLSACQNNEVVCKQDNPPPSVESLATYVMTDFFALAHATGLYNRQTQLWEALSKVTAIHVVQQQAGLFQKSALPVYDFSFVDYKGKTLLYALLVDGQAPKMKPPLTILKSFIGRAKNKWGCQGVLAAFSKPMPPDVLSFIQHATATPDPIARYESILPALKLPFDLLEMDKSKLGSTAEPSEADNPDEPDEPITIFRLLHPDLRKKDGLDAPSRPRPPKKKKVETDEETTDSDSTDPVPARSVPAALLNSGLDPDDILDQLDREAAVTGVALDSSPQQPEISEHQTQRDSNYTLEKTDQDLDKTHEEPEPVSVSASTTTVDDEPAEASVATTEKKSKKSSTKKTSASKGTRSSKSKSVASESSSNEGASTQEPSAQEDPAESHEQSTQEPSQPDSEPGEK